MRKHFISILCIAPLALVSCISSTEKPVDAVTSAPTIETGSGSMVPPTKESAEQVRSKAEAGDANAQFELGTMYEHGDGVPVDFQKAAEWYKKSAAQNNRQAAFNLGLFYKKGTGVDQDATSARNYFEKAEKLGEVRSANQLGLIYYTGNGAQKDIDEAFRHFKIAAMGQMPEAQVNLGVMYVRGDGMDAPDPLEGYAWLSIAKDGGSDKGAQLEAKLKEKLPPEQIADAIKRKALIQKEIVEIDRIQR